jgi:hypothetical protein
MQSLNASFLNLLQDDYRNYNSFIETGTNKGDTTFAMEPHFDNIHTIEISEKYYNETKSKYVGNKINFLLGDSSHVFKSLLPTINNKSIFFLDGHWSSGDTGRGEKDCPLVEEITLINNLFKHSAIIIIDDYRLFGKGPNSGLNEDWTDINKIKLTGILQERISKVYHLGSERDTNDRLIIHIDP